MLTILVGTGVFYTIRLKFLPLRNLFYAIGIITEKEDKKEGDVSPLHSLMISLSGTFGAGNIIGVGTAMVLGGPGALVWMWISAFFGISTKYAESVLAVKYRVKNRIGEMAGGPMYAMKYGIGGVFGAILAACFAIFTVFASFGGGNMTAAYSLASTINMSFGIPNASTGAIITIFSLAIFMRGTRVIGNISSIMIPFSAVFYCISALIVIGVNITAVPEGIVEILRAAFSLDAAAGGVGGNIVASMFNAMRWGITRGVFSHESGIGSAPIAAAAARTSHPSRQGYINMIGTFFDTMVICMLTGLVIASSGVLGMTDPETGKVIFGEELTILAFRTAFGDAAPIVISISLALFTFTSLLGWGYYGERALEYLISARPAIMVYRMAFSLATFVGATTTLDFVWNFSDAMNGLMMIPNLICLLWLSKDVAKECFDYETKRFGV